MLYQFRNSFFFKYVLNFPASFNCFCVEYFHFFIKIIADILIIFHPDLLDFG